MKLAHCVSAVFVIACSSAPNVDPIPDAAPPQGDDSGSVTTDDGGSPSEPDVSAPQACTYPKGPYGVSTGQVLSPNASWQGYAANDTNVTTLHVTDLYDCDGKKGIDAIIIDVSAGWCAACEAQAHDDATLMSQYDALGIKSITLLIMDAAENPATTATALDWRTTYGLGDVGIYADPNFVLQPNEQTIGLPITMVVDPRTMKVVAETEGYGSAYPLKPNATAVALAQKNH